MVRAMPPTAGTTSPSCASTQTEGTTGSSGEAPNVDPTRRWRPSLQCGRQPKCPHSLAAGTHHPDSQPGPPHRQRRPGHQMPQRRGRPRDRLHRAPARDLRRDRSPTTSGTPRHLRPPPAKSQSARHEPHRVPPPDRMLTTTTGHHDQSVASTGGVHRPSGSRLRASASPTPSWLCEVAFLEGGLRGLRFSSSPVPLPLRFSRNGRRGSASEGGI